MAAQSSPEDQSSPQLFANFSPTSLCRAKIVLAVGRIAHQMGYASGGYGKHAPGHLEPVDVAGLDGVRGAGWSEQLK